MTRTNSEDFLNLLLPDSDNDFLVDLLRREIWITGQITGGLSRPVVRGLREMAQLSSAPITIFVNTEGGDPYEAMIIADIMLALDRKGITIRTCVMGISYSAGVIISAAGSLDSRTAIPSSDFLIHQLSVSNISGKIGDVEAATVSLKRLNEKIGEQLTELTGSSLEHIKDLMSKDSYLDAKGAQELGLIDRIAIPDIDEGE